MAPSTRIGLPEIIASTDAAQTTKPVRLGLFGLFGTGNFGNDASLEAVLFLVRRQRPTAALTCICGNPEVIGPLFKIHCTRINYRKPIGWKATLNRFLGQAPREFASTVSAFLQLMRLDLMIIPGTGILDDFNTGPFGMPYAIFRWCMLARLLGTKVLFLNIGAGPISHPLSRFFMKSAARLADYRSYRDEVSWRYMQAIGVNVKGDGVYPDVAFTLPRPERTSLPPDGEPPVIGVGLMSYNGWRGDIVRQTDIYDAYMITMTKMVRRLLLEGYRVRLISGDEHDKDAIEDLMQRLQSDEVPHIDNLSAAPAHSIHDVMKQLADTHVVIATRYHNVVAALIMNKPTLSLGYAAKNKELLSRMGLGDYCQHIEEIDFELLMDQFHQLLANREMHERTLEVANKAFRQILISQQEKLLNDFCLNAPRQSPASPLSEASQSEITDANK